MNGLPYDYLIKVSFIFIYSFDWLFCLRSGLVVFRASGPMRQTLR